MAQDWQMPRRGETCAACERKFEVGEAFRAFLYETPEGFSRRDYCDACTVPDESQSVGWWRTHRPEPAARTPTFDRAALYGFFRQLAASDDGQRRQLRFVLALLLWRKKVLKFDTSRTGDDGLERWHFTVPRSDETHTVIRPDLDETQIALLSEQLEQLLADQIDEPAAAATETGGDDSHD